MFIGAALLIWGAALLNGVQRSSWVAALLSGVQRSSAGCGVVQLVVRRLALRQARVRFSSRHPIWRLLLLSRTAMKIQDGGFLRMAKYE